MSIKVLVVDDSKSMRAVVKKTLVAAGFDMEECFEASNGLEALEILDREHVDVVLSDLHMPKMNGMELLAKLQADKRVPPCFILVTTEGRTEKLKEALALGARGFVVKPFQPEGLRKILSLFVGEPHGSDLDDGPEGLDF